MHKDGSSETYKLFINVIENLSMIHIDWLVVKMNIRGHLVDMLDLSIGLH